MKHTFKYKDWAVFRGAICSAHHTADLRKAPCPTSYGFISPSKYNEDGTLTVVITNKEKFLFALMKYR